MYVAHVQQQMKLLFKRETESEDASTTVPKAMVFMTIFGSFQNQTPVAAAVLPVATECTLRGRKHVISALLTDIANTSGEPFPQKSALQAMRTIESQNVHCAPRGNLVQ